jgi:glycosyltransferase involved in cell wall biosynthesis
MNEFVSVIMPVYNRQDTVKQAIESILEQTYSNFELIVIDDASTDNTANVVRTLTDERIRFYSHEKNLGGSAARNTGIKQARAKWIAFQDSDDMWRKDKLEKQVARIPKQLDDKPPIIYTSFYRFKNGKKEYIPNKDSRKKQGNIHKELIEGNFISTQTVMLAKECLEAVGGFAEDMPRFQDWELWIRLSEKYPFIWVDEPLVDVYYSEGSISSSQDKIVIAYENILQKHKQRFQKAGSKYYASYLCSYGHNLCLAGDVKKGREILFQAYRLNNKSVKCFVSLISSMFGTRFYKQIYSYYNR